MLFISFQPSWFEVFAALGKFGTIVGFREHEDSSSVLFTLKNTDKTAELTTIGEIRCGRFNIPIQGPWYDGDHPENIRSISENLAPTDDVSSTTFEDLNDDCLWEIFRRLVIDDLCSIARTSIRFNALAGEMFRFQYGKHKFVFDSSTWPFHRYVVLLRVFGEYIKSINIDNVLFGTAAYDEIALGLIAYHCRNIEHLKCDSLLPICSAIKRYERLQAKHSTGGVSPFSMLKTLKWENCHTLNNVYRSRVCDYGDYSCFGRLRSLKTFACGYDDILVHSILKAMCDGRVQLERLKIRTTMFPGFIGSMSSIKFLKFRHWGIEVTNRPQLISVISANLEEIEHFARNPPTQLQTAKFHIRDFRSFTNQMENNRHLIAAIDKIVKKRAIELHVELRYSTREPRSISDAVLNQCRDWLSIRIH